MITVCDDIASRGRPRARHRCGVRLGGSLLRR